MTTDVLVSKNLGIICLCLVTYLFIISGSDTYELNAVAVCCLMFPQVHEGTPYTIVMWRLPPGYQWIVSLQIHNVSNINIYYSCTTSCDQSCYIESIGDTGQKVFGQTSCRLGRVLLWKGNFWSPFQHEDHNSRYRDSRFMYKGTAVMRPYLVFDGIYDG